MSIYYFLSLAKEQKIIVVLGNGEEGLQFPSLGGNEAMMLLHDVLPVSRRATYLFRFSATENP